MNITPTSAMPELLAFAYPTFAFYLQVKFNVYMKYPNATVIALLAGIVAILLGIVFLFIKFRSRAPIAIAAAVIAVVALVNLLFTFVAISEGYYPFPLHYMAGILVLLFVFLLLKARKIGNVS